MELTINERIKKFCEYKRIAVSTFEKSCDLSNGYVKSIKKSLGTEKLDNVLNAFPELNREWLLYGEGEMLKSEGVSEETEEIKEESIIPFIDGEVIRKRNFNVRKAINNDTIEKKVFEDLFNSVDFIKKIITDSMYPLLQNGDYALIKFLPDDANIISGAIYLVDTKSYGTLIGQVFVKEKSFELHFINHNYTKIDIAREDIYSFGLIVHSIRNTFNMPQNFATLEKSLSQVDKLIDELCKQSEHSRNIEERMMNYLTKK